MEIDDRPKNPLTRIKECDDPRYYLEELWRLIEEQEKKINGPDGLLGYGERQSEAYLAIKQFMGEIE